MYGASARFGLTVWGSRGSKPDAEVRRRSLCDPLSKGDALGPRPDLDLIGDGVTSIDQGTKDRLKAGVGVAEGRGLGREVGGFQGEDGETSVGEGQDIGLPRSDEGRFCGGTGQDHCGIGRIGVMGR